MYHTDYQAVLLITLKLMKQAVGDKKIRSPSCTSLKHDINCFYIIYSSFYTLCSSSE